MPNWIERHEIERLLVEGDQAFVTYQCVAKSGNEFSQHRVLRTSTATKIKRIDVYFGATYENGAFVKAATSWCREGVVGRPPRPPGVTEMSLTLHFHPLASYCHKALIALYENDTPFRRIWSISATRPSAPRC